MILKVVAVVYEHKFWCWDGKMLMIFSKIFFNIYIYCMYVRVCGIYIYLNYIYIYICVCVFNCIERNVPLCIVWLWLKSSVWWYWWWLVFEWMNEYSALFYSISVKHQSINQSINRHTTRGLVGWLQSQKEPKPSLKLYLNYQYIFSIKLIWLLNVDVDDVENILI